MNQHDARPAGLAPDASLQDGQPRDGQLRDAQPEAETSVVRGGPEWRQLSFRTSGLTIELEITGGGEYRRLMGQLILRPDQPALPAGPDQAPIVTGWISL